MGGGVQVKMKCLNLTESRVERGHEIHRMIGLKQKVGVSEFRWWVATGSGLSWTQV